MIDLEYTPVPARIGTPSLGDPSRADEMRARVAQFLDVPLPTPNTDGEIEQLGEVEVVHRFVDAPGDSETVRWHFVEAGEGEPIVFLHGVPETWWSWHHQVEAFAATHRVIAVDLKGYGQSDKKTGDYRHEGVSEQMLAMLDQIGLEEFNLVTHDRGTVQADYLAANHPNRVLRYARGEQHLWHFNPALAPQQEMIVNPETAGFLDNRFTPVGAYFNLCHYPIADSDVARAVQEWSFPQTGWAVRRYFNSSSFRQEWIDRRTRLVERWSMPVLVMEGYHDHLQPREFYEDVAQHLPNGRVELLDAGHFFLFEKPDETTKVLREFLA